jgi:DNA invertase Pin-like site-specific DNA recombinase
LFVRAYLRASTAEQDADRARAPLQAFAAERGLDLTGWLWTGLIERISQD